MACDRCPRAFIYRTVVFGKCHTQRFSRRSHSRTQVAAVFVLEPHSERRNASCLTKGVLLAEGRRGIMHHHALESVVPGIEDGTR